MRDRLILSLAVTVVEMASKEIKTPDPKKQVEDALLANAGSGRKRRKSLPWPLNPEFWTKIPTVWKVLTVVAAIFVSGATGYAYLRAYTDKYATKEDLKAQSQEISNLKEGIRLLREAAAKREGDLAAAKSDMASMREDVRTLLQHMLANPPPRPRSDNK